MKHESHFILFVQGEMDTKLFGHASATAPVSVPRRGTTLRTAAEVSWLMRTT
jgi:hypothetical protein